MKMELRNLFRYIDQHTCTLASFSARMKSIYWSSVCPYSVLWHNVHHGKSHDSSVVDSTASGVHCEWAVYRTMDKH